ncbi:uncharacterized protein LOC144438774 [Glandiceps talaboti]
MGKAGWIFVIFIAVIIYFVSRPRPPLRYVNDEGNNTKLAMPVYYSHVGIATFPRTANEHFRLLQKLFLMNIADEGGVNAPPPPKYSQRLNHPVLQSIFKMLIRLFKKWMPEVPITFFTRDPREHHQLALLHHRSETVEFNELNYYAFRVDSLETLRKVGEMVMDDPAVKNFRAINECDQWAVFITDDNGDMIKIYVETGYHIQDFVQFPFNINSVSIKEETQMICSKLPGFQTRRHWLTSLRKEYPFLEDIDRPGKFWAEDQANDPWQRNISFSHVSMKVHNIDGMVAFYSRIMGLFPAKYGYLGNNRIVRMIGRDYRLFEFIEARPLSEVYLDLPIVHQLSFRLQSIDHLRRLQDQLQHEPVHSVIPITHGNCWALYFCDPENNMVEAFVDGPNFVQQPIVNFFDLDGVSEEELHHKEVVAWQHHPSFKTYEEYWKTNAKEWGLTEKN